jgi:hypothetical protein
MSPDVMETKETRQKPEAETRSDRHKQQNEYEEIMQHTLTRLGEYVQEATWLQSGKHFWSQDPCQKCKVTSGLDCAWQRDHLSSLLKSRPLTSDFNMTPHWTFILDDLLVDSSRLFHSASCWGGRHHNYVTSVRFPQFCCECMASVTHYEAVSIDATVEGNRKAGEWHKCWYALPFCDEHSLGSHPVQIIDCVFPVAQATGKLAEASRPKAVFRVANHEWGRLFGEFNGLSGFGWGIHYFLQVQGGLDRLREVIE